MGFPKMTFYFLFSVLFCLFTFTAIMGRRRSKAKWIKHYSSKHEILLVGEGDFSFAACLAAAFGNASNITATSLDSEGELLRKHSTAEANLNFLEEMGATVIHNVDASTMRKRRLLRHLTFDRIVFNFPHAGFVGSGYHEKDPHQISRHQKVVRGFLRNAREMVAEGGEVHVTHRADHPYCKWEIEEVAEEEGLVLKESAVFNRWEYPGYINKRGSGCHSNRTFPVGDSLTYKFAKT